jgi:hypothetical protein
MMDVVEGDSVDPSVESAFKAALPMDYRGGVSSLASSIQVTLLTGVLHKD